MDRKLIFEFLPAITEGGAETLVKDYGVFIDKDKFDIVVVVTHPIDYESANYNLLSEQGVNVVSLNPKMPRISNWILRNLYRYLLFPFLTSLRLRKLIKKNNPYAIHCHLRVLEYLYRIRKSLRGIKLFYTCHNRPDFMFDYRRNYFELLSAKYFCKNSKLQLIALHEDMKNELNELFHINNTVVIHNGIDFSRFEPTGESDLLKIKKSLGIPEGLFVIGHIGRFSAQKNHEFLVKIFDAVRIINPDTYLLMIGDGPLKKRIDDKLKDLGHKGYYSILSNRKDIPNLLSVMDVFLLPSNFEGLPVTMVEAQVAGLRCVVADNITTECFFSKKVVPLSILDKAEIWAKTIIDNSIEGNYSQDISLFDMRKEIKRIEKLYLGELL